MEYLLDSFAWLEYFGGNSKYAQYVEGSRGALPFTVVTSLTEVVRSLLRKKVEKTEVLRLAQFIASRSVVLQLDALDAIQAGFIAEEHGLHFSDALIYSLAGKNRVVVTGDPHFKSLANVEFIE